MELDIKNPTLKFEHDIIKILEESNYDNVDMDVNVIFTLLNNNLENRWIVFRNEIIDILKDYVDVDLVNKLENKQLNLCDIINLMDELNDNIIFDCNDIYLFELVMKLYNDMKNLIECYNDYNINDIRNYLANFLTRYHF